MSGSIVCNICEACLHSDRADDLSALIPEQYFYAIVFPPGYLFQCDALWLSGHCLYP